MSQRIPIGVRYEMPLIPPVEANTQYIGGGASVKVGIEHRVLTEKTIRDAYGSSPEARSSEDPSVLALEAAFDDVGISVHVLDARDETEYLRFDAFAEDPHYHYLHRNAAQEVVGFDVAAHGDDMLAWIFESLNARLPEMLEYAGAHELADSVRREDLSSVLESAKRLALQKRANDSVCERW